MLGCLGLEWVCLGLGLVLGILRTFRHCLILSRYTNNSHINSFVISSLGAAPLAEIGFRVVQHVLECPFVATIDLGRW